MTAAIHVCGSEEKGPDPVAGRSESGAPETLAHSTIGRRSPRRCRPSPRFLVECGLLGVIHAPSCTVGSVLADTHSALQAIAALKPNPMPFISIAAWGLGPTGDYITGFFTRTLVGIAKTLFWSKPHADFEKQLAEIEEARNEGLIRPILILPPLLNNMEKTDIYLSGEASTIKDAMGVTSFVSRASMADLCLRLGEKAASGEEVPQWVGITNP